MSHLMYRLLTPGPVQIPPEVLAELAKPMLHHRTPEFEAILTQVLAKLKIVFQTAEPVLLLPSTGSGAMEAAVVNTLSPGDEALFVVSGKFGERWFEIAKAHGIRAIALNVEWGQAVKPSDITRMLEQHPDCRAVFCQACETSTAVWHPIGEIASLIEKRPQTIFAVDGITAVGVAPLPMDQWGIDVLVAGSQKAFMLPAGLSMISFSKKAWQIVQTSRNARYYFDVRKEREANTKKQTFFSSPVSLIRGLNSALNMMLQDGLVNNFTRYKKLSQGLRAGATSLGFEIYGSSPSPSVTALIPPANLNAEKIRDHLESHYKITVMGGQDKLRGKIIRVGTLGWVRNEDIQALLQGLSSVLADLDVKSDPLASLEAFDRASR